MRLRTQFAILIAAVTLVPILFGIILFGAQSEPRDPRAPTKEFLAILNERWMAGDELDMDDLQSAAELSGMPLREAAVVARDGEVLVSTFRHIAVGSHVNLIDLARPPRGASGQPNPEIRLMPIDGKNDESPMILFDIQPFWSKQDIRNRNILIVALFALGLFVVAGVISVLILRSMSRSIKKLETDTAIVASGDLDHPVTGSGSHEILHLASSINMMRLNLKDMLARRSRMMMGISHDLKTPIALIQGYADALSDEVAVDEATKRKYLDIIKNKSCQLEELASALVDFLKIGGDGAYSIVPVDPSALLVDMGKRFASDAALMNREFRWGFGPELAPAPSFHIGEVSMNRALTERALENFVMNAFRFSGQGGTVTMELSRSPDGLVFAIIDDGPGISNQDLPYVFDAFYRASPSRADGGQGLGLTVVKAVAELHGWKSSLGQRADGRPGSEARLLMTGT